MIQLISWTYLIDKYNEKLTIIYVSINTQYHLNFYSLIINENTIKLAFR